jgi:predicted dienelactone hydrolase
LINELHDNSFITKTLAFENAKADMSKLMVSGHSFGGTTALTVAL